MGIVKIIKNFYMRISSTAWNIGFVENIFEGNSLERLPKVNWIKHTLKDVWFADPFILNVDDNIIEVLVEEWQDSARKGRISKLIVDRKSFELLKITPILDLTTHLSFPAILRIDKDVYVYPENSQSGVLNIYKYVDDKLEKVTCLSDSPLVDAIILPDKIYGKSFIFSTEAIDVKSPSGNILSVYEADSLLAQYKKIDEIKFGDRCGRNAGNVFEYSGKKIRPAQDCNIRYGHGLVFQEVEYKTGKFQFKEISRLYPISEEYNLGIHTFNIFENLAVVDGYKYRNKILGSILEYFKISKLLIRIRNMLRK